MLDRGIIKKVLFFFKKVLNFCFPPKIFHMPVFFVIFFFVCLCVCLYFGLFQQCNWWLQPQCKKKEKKERTGKKYEGRSTAQFN